MIDPKDPNIVGYECKHVVYCPSTQGEPNDIHFIKEAVHYKDGTTKPNTRMIKNFQREFYVTKKGMRKHNEKKESELIENLDKYSNNQARIYQHISRVLNIPFRGKPKDLTASPYLYGVDIKSTALLKVKYNSKFPDLKSKSSVAAYDIETDVLNDVKDEKPIISSLTFKDRVVCVIRRDFLKNYSDPIPVLEAAAIKYIGKYIEERNIKIEWVLVDNEAGCVTEIFKRAHEWKPDIISSWNQDFDITRSINALTRNGLNPVDVFSDPSVPPQYRKFRYMPGASMKITDSGKMMPLGFEDRWNVVDCSSSFYFLDAMTTYKRLRSAAQKEPSYSLDAILAKENLPSKLKFEEADGLKGISWHKFMQKNYPIEYVIYNIFDDIALELLDEKVMDLSNRVPKACDCSDFADFKSQPRRLNDKLHFYYQKYNRIIGTTSSNMMTETDGKLLSLKGWISTLPAQLVTDDGVQVINEDNKLRTNIRTHTYDLDVSSSYPSTQYAMNISKSTTKRELIGIRGIPMRVQRLCYLNLSGGATNAVDICNKLFNLPSLIELSELYDLSKGNPIYDETNNPVKHTPLYSEELLKGPVPKDDAVDEEEDEDEDED